jgi:hypothetical protein
MDVGGKFQKIGVFFTEDGLVPTLEEVTPGPIFKIVMAGISKLQTLHDFRKRGVLDFNQKMNVGGHKHVGVEEEGIPLLVFFQEPQIEFIILRGFENLCAPVPPGDDVVKSACKMDPRLSCHKPILSTTNFIVNTYYLMSDPILDPILYV